MNVSKDIRFRVYICFMLMCVFAVAILAKGAQVIIVEGDALRAYADSIYTKVEVLSPERGNIYTEDGSLVASSIPEFDIRVDFKSINKDTFYKYLPKLSYTLSKVLQDKSSAEYRTILTKEYKKGSRYYRLARRVDYSNYVKIQQMQPFAKGANKGGFIAEANTKRINPFGLLANRTVGIWRNNAPNVGLEDAFNKDLNGKEGSRAMKKIAGGAWMPIDGSEIAPENGKDIITTLDMNIQDVAQNALRNQLEYDQAAYGTCIVMEVKTGKIKALANLGRQVDGSYYEDKNYALAGIEPGSTCKVISLISLLNDKKINITDKINCGPGRYKIGPRTVTDSHPVGLVSIEDALAQSSNIGFFKMIYGNYKTDREAYLRNLKRLHLDQPTGIEIKGESKSNLNETRIYDEEYLVGSMGYGYGMKLTPLHMCMVYNTVANNGVMMKPYLVNSIKEYGKDVQAFMPKVLNSNAIRKDAIPAITDAMNAVVERGTGKKLKNPYYSICGKTGTARVSDGNTKYSDRVYHASFIGFFPKENPQYTIAVVVRTSRNSRNYYGGLLALPVFQQVANRLYATHVQTPKSYVNTDSLHNMPSLKNVRNDQMSMIAKVLGVKTNKSDATWLTDVKPQGAKNWSSQALSVRKGEVPNVKGMGLRNAMYLLENKGLRVIPVGKGKVATQSIEEGTAIRKGQTITLHLS